MKDASWSEQTFFLFSQAWEQEQISVLVKYVSTLSEPLDVTDGQTSFGSNTF